jgi:hypothetical protein
LVGDRGYPPASSLVRETSQLLALRRLQVRQGQLYLFRARPHRRLPCAPPSPAQWATEPNRLQLPPARPGHCWIDSQLEPSVGPSAAYLEASRQEALIGPLRNVYGVSDKVLTMALSSLLIGARGQRPVWFETGKAMMAIDTLVHNFLHRTGILEGCGTPHVYGRMLSKGPLPWEHPVYFATKKKSSLPGNDPYVYGSCRPAVASITSSRTRRNTLVISTSGVAMRCVTSQDRLRSTCYAPLSPNRQRSTSIVAIWLLTGPHSLVI